jgi:hypothetical protein
MKKKEAVPEIDTDKINLVEVVLLKSSINSTDDYLNNTVKPVKVQMNLGQQIHFDFSNNITQLRLEIQIDGYNSDDMPLGLQAEFMGTFHFTIGNLNAFLVGDEGQGEVQVHAILGATLLGIAFSTFRGIVLERTKGTPFAGFLLPIINPMKTLLALTGTPSSQNASAKNIENPIQSSKRKKS